MGNYPPRNTERNEERVFVPFQHAALAATQTMKVYKVPAGRSFLLDRVLYANTTGLAEDTANNFEGLVKNLAASLADATFTVANAADEATVAAHGMVTGDGPFFVSNSGGGLPAGLAAFTKYWVIKTGTNTFKFATSLANAKAGTVIDLTTDGTGTQTLIRNIVTRLFNTDSDLVPDIGTNLAADASLEYSLDVDVMHRVIAGGDWVSVVLTKFGTATLPYGQGLLEGRLL